MQVNEALPRRSWLKIAAASGTGVLLGGYSVLASSAASARAQVAPDTMTLKLAKLRFERRVLTADSQRDVADSLAPVFLTLAKQSGPLEGTDDELLAKIRRLTSVKGSLLSLGNSAETELSVSGLKSLRTRAQLDRLQPLKTPAVKK